MVNEEDHNEGQAAAGLNQLGNILAEDQHNPQQGNNHAATTNSHLRPPRPLIISGKNAADNWKLWIQQYEWYEIATGMQQRPQNIQIATFMSSIGTESVVIFNTFGCTAQELANLAQIKERFKLHFTPKTNYTFERYLFNKMFQDEGEECDEFLIRIKAQSAKCNLAAVHDSLLRDRIIVGIRNESLREQLLVDDESTLNVVVQRCRTIEIASKQMRGLQGNSKYVNAIGSKTSKPTQQRRPHQYSDAETFDCKRCGQIHGPKSCPAFKKKCNMCEREGHFAQMCQSSKSRENRSHKKVYAVEENTDDEFYVSVVSKERAPSNRDNDRSWCEQVDIGDVSIKVKLDSGAECNVIPKAVADQIGETKPTNTKGLITYSGDRIQVAGQIIARTT